MTEDLRTPRFADQIVVLQHAAVRLKLRACNQRKNEMFVPQAHQLGKIAGLCDGRRSH
jgi:hypothetical protein